MQQGEKKVYGAITFFLRNLVIAPNFHEYLHITSLNFLTLVGTIVYFQCCIIIEGNYFKKKVNLKKIHWQYYGMIFSKAFVNRTFFLLLILDFL